MIGSQDAHSLVSAVAAFALNAVGTQSSQVILTRLDPFCFKEATLVAKLGIVKQLDPELCALRLRAVGGDLARGREETVPSSGSTVWMGL